MNILPIIIALAFGAKYAAAEHTPCAFPWEGEWVDLDGEHSTPGSSKYYGGRVNSLRSDPASWMLAPALGGRAFDLSYNEETEVVTMTETYNTGAVFVSTFSASGMDSSTQTIQGKIFPSL